MVFCQSVCHTNSGVKYKDAAVTMYGNLQQAVAYTAALCAPMNKTQSQKLGQHKRTGVNVLHLI